MADPFKDNADLAFQIQEDAPAKAFLHQLGLLNKFAKEDTLPKPWCEAIAFAGHTTHWILARRLTGFPNAIDNGYVVDGFPKSQLTIDQANPRFQKLCHELFPDGVVPRISPLEPPNN